MQTTTIRTFAFALTVLALAACSSDQEGAANSDSPAITTPPSDSPADDENNDGDAESDGRSDDPVTPFTTDEPYEVWIDAHAASTQPPRGYEGERWLEGVTVFDEEYGELRDLSEEEMKNVDRVVTELMSEADYPQPACTGVETLTIIISQDDTVYHEETVGSCQDGNHFETVSGLYVMFGSR